MTVNQFANGGVNEEQALCHRLAGVGHNDPEIDRLRIGLAFNYPVAEARRTGVEPNRDHARPRATWLRLVPRHRRRHW
jgi:hypothetical protein